MKEVYIVRDNKSIMAVYDNAASAVRLVAREGAVYYDKGKRSNAIILAEEIKLWETGKHALGGWLDQAHYMCITAGVTMSITRYPVGRAINRDKIRG